MPSISGNIGSLVLFLLVVVGGGTLIGSFTAPQAWYRGLTKPSFNPPNWIFGPVWFLLYICIALAGWIMWNIDPGGLAMKLWFAQLILNFAWAPTFFRGHSIGAALAIIILMLLTIVGFIVTAWGGNHVAAYLFVPYALWVGFATVLNGAILRLNRLTVP